MAKRRKIAPGRQGGRTHIWNLMGYPPGTPIEDGKEDIAFKVTKADVAKASAKIPNACGYAKALCRKTGYGNVHVYRNTTLIGGKDVIWRYKNAQNMRLIINKFDLTGKMAEHDMILRAPTGGSRIEVERERSAIYKDAIRSGKHKVKPRGPIDTGSLKLLRPRLMESYV